LPITLPPPLLDLCYDKCQHLGFRLFGLNQE